MRGGGRISQSCLRSHPALRIYFWKHRTLEAPAKRTRSWKKRNKLEVRWSRYLISRSCNKNPSTWVRNSKGQKPLRSLRFQTLELETRHPRSRQDLANQFLTRRSQEGEMVSNNSKWAYLLLEVSEAIGVDFRYVSSWGEHLFFPGVWSANWQRTVWNLLWIRAALGWQLIGQNWLEIATWKRSLPAWGLNRNEWLHVHLLPTEMLPTWAQLQQGSFKTNTTFHATAAVSVSASSCSCIPFRSPVKRPEYPEQGCHVTKSHTAMQRLITRASRRADNWCFCRTGWMYLLKYPRHVPSRRATWPGRCDNIAGSLHSHDSTLQGTRTAHHLPIHFPFQNPRAYRTSSI
jgi:hypothetical protein